MNFKHFFSTLSVLLLLSCSNESSNDSEQQGAVNCEGLNISTETFHISSQADIDSFLSGNYKQVGRVSVAFQSDLSFLNCVEIIDGLQLDQCTFSSLEGLSNLESVGSLRITNCNNLINLEGIGQIDVLNSIDIEGCENLVSLTGLESVQTLDTFLEIINNPSLISLDGLEGVTAINDTGLVNWEITGNVNLEDITALNNIVSSKMPNLSLDGTSLSNLGAFNNVTGLSNFNITGDNISEITCFPNVTEAIAISVYNCDNLNLISFPSLNRMAYLRVEDNRDLTALNFSQLTEFSGGSNGDFNMRIDNNESLENLSGFQNLEQNIGIMQINTSYSNPSENPLINICGLRNLILEQISNGTFGNAVEYKTACSSHFGLYTDIVQFDNSCNCD